MMKGHTNTSVGSTVRGERQCSRRDGGTSYSGFGPLIETCRAVARRRWTWIVALVAVFWSVGCDDANLDHPAADRARAYLEAVQYHDVERAFRHHVESTEHGIYCASDSFKKVLERTKDQKTESDCRDVRELTPKRRAALADDAELLVQILRFTCEQPDGDCRDYARRVFTTQFPESKLWHRLETFEMKRLELRSGGDEAVVYVDIRRKSEAKTAIFHRSLTLETYDGRWYVTDQPERRTNDDAR